MKPYEAQEITLAQQEFVARQNRRKRLVAMLRILLLAFLVILWEASARFGIINDFIFSSPSRIGRCFYTMVADGSIFLHTGITILETLVSFFFVITLGILGAVLLWSSRTVSEVLDPYLVMLNSLPKSALAPILIVWLGNNMKTIIVAAVSVAVFGSILTLHNGFMNVDPDQVKLIYSLGGKRKDVLKKVLLPGSVPLIISNMKVNIGLCLVGVIIGEFLAAKAGLGYLIIYGSQVFRFDHIQLMLLNRIARWTSEYVSRSVEIVKSKDYFFHFGPIRKEKFTQDEIEVLAVTVSLVGLAKTIIDTPVISKDGDAYDDGSSRFDETCSVLELLELEENKGQ